MPNDTPWVFPYTATQLTEQVNRIPNQFGLLQDMGLFSTEGAISTLIEVRLEDGILVVLPAKERGAPASEADRGPGRTLYFEVPHFPHKDTILPRDIQNMLVLAALMKRPATIDDEMAKRLFNIRNNHAVTLEYVRMGALKGEIRDGRNRLIYNLFAEFGIEKKVVYFNLANADADIIGFCEQVMDHVMMNLQGEVSSGVEVIVSGQFFNRFIQHPKVEKHWLNWQAAAAVANMQRDRVGGNWGREYEFGNLWFREYKGMFPIKLADVATSVPAVTAGKGHAFPRGTMDTFKTWFAPADTMSAANKPGDEVFISPKPLDHDKGVELWSESNPLAMVKRPEVLVEIDEGVGP